MSLGTLISFFLIAELLYLLMDAFGMVMIVGIQGLQRMLSIGNEKEHGTLSMIRRSQTIF